MKDIAIYGAYRFGREVWCLLKRIDKETLPTCILNKIYLLVTALSFNLK